MKQTVNFYPYCASDEEFEYDWFEGYPGFKLEEQEEEFDFFDRIDNAVESFFKKAFTEIEPLLDKISLKEIHIMSDYSGMISAKKFLASWQYGKSKTEKGHYLFIASPTMISASLHMANDPDFNVGSNIRCVWQHELIHIADQKAILYSDKWRQFRSDRMIRNKYLSAFRIEGIADLFYLCKGHSVAVTVNDARTRFQQDLERIKAIDTTSLKDRKAYGAVVTDTDKPYSAGPLMVLHALSVSTNEVTKKKAISALEKIAVRMILSNEDIFSLIRAAVKMDIETFMSALEMPGADGSPFTCLEAVKETIIYPKTLAYEDTCCAS